MATGAATKLVCFYLHGQEYAVGITEVKETLGMRPITRVFLTPPWLAGIINLRGDVVAVLDLAQLLGQAPTLITDDSRIIIARHDGKVAGFIADRLAELRAIDLESVQPPPEILSDDAMSVLRGVATVDGGNALRVLSLADMFDSDRLRSFEQAVGE
jgi:purine-binding chemotaxis protein CheW